MMAKYSPFAVQIRDANDDGVRGKFSLNVKHETLDEKMFSWEIERTVEQFQNLRMDLLRENKNLDINQFVADDVSSDLSQLQTTFTSLLNDVGDQAWHHKSLLKFLEDSSSPSVIMNLKVDHLSDQVLQLTNDLRLQTERVESLQTSHNCLFNIVQDILSGNDSSVKRRLSSGRSSQELLRSMYQQQAFASASNTSTNFTDGEIDDCSNRSSFMSVGMPDLPHNSSSKGPDTLSTANGLTSFSHSSDLGDHDVVTLKLDSESKSPLPLRERAMEELLKESPDKSEKAEPSKAALALAPVLSRQITDDVTSSNGSIPSTPHFPAHLHPSEAMSAYYSAAVDQILRAVRPNNAQMQYRASVISMLKKQVRLCLNSNAMPTGLHDILCSLPDDPINVSVVLSKNLLTNWHICLVDRLNLVNERLATTGNFDMVFAEEEEQLMYLPDDYSSPMRHEVTHMTHNKLNMNFSIQLNVDNSCEVEVLANNRHDLCMLAFVEEFASLVGKEDLFKRSLLLIRAWWHYETAAYVGTPIKHYLKDSNICVMVCAIFNQFHMRISSPLQALCLFLAEYSAYDGATQAITLQGIVPFKSATSSQPLLLDAQPSHLVSCEIIEKYWNLFNLSSASADSTGYENIIRSTSSDDYFQDDTNGLSIAAASAVVLSVDHDRSAPGGIEKINMKNLSSHNLHYFERQLFSVVHPFCHTNMVQEKLSSRRQMRLHKAFQIGASEMTVYLKQSTHNANNAKDILNYFPSVLARFDEVFAHNKTFLPTAAESVVDPRYYSNAEKLASSIMYCNLMLESVLSEPALLTLSTEILAVKGPLPVGEIGKLLAETTSIGSLSQKLKERFGGLKKFLERFPTAFVLSNDHPFNPSVLLRSSLSAEHRDLIDRGIFPHQLLQKTKKAAAPAKKKKSPGPDFNTSGNLISSSGSPSSNQGSPFLGVQAHKFMTSPSLTLTHAKYITNNNGVNGVNINKNPMNSPPAVQQHKLARISSFPNQFPPPNSGPQQQNQQQLQQQQQQQQQMSMGYGGGNYSQQQQQQQLQQQSKQMANMGMHNTVSPSQQLYAQSNPHGHQQQQQYPQQQQQGGGSFNQQGPPQLQQQQQQQQQGYQVVSPNNNQFTRSFREGDLNHAGAFNVNNNIATKGNAAPIKRHSYHEGSSQTNVFLSHQPNYYNDILTGGSAGNISATGSSSLNINTGLEGTAGPIGRRPSYTGGTGSNGSSSNNNSNSHLLSTLRLSDLPPSPPKDQQQQRLTSGPGALYGLGATESHPSPTDSSQYSAFQSYRNSPAARAAPLSFQTHPPQQQQQQGPHSQVQANQQGLQASTLHNFHSSEDPTNSDSFLRDFSKF
mmetsp:Transcript_62739/g.110821  ORF Transcript_62739/g.110821 Transcript_62739/m.110821 type:complete len:1342 (-) Transcript_62739:1184-5209(-)